MKATIARNLGLNLAMPDVLWLNYQRWEKFYLLYSTKKALPTNLLVSPKEKQLSEFFYFDENHSRKYHKFKAVEPSKRVQRTAMRYELLLLERILKEMLKLPTYLSEVLRTSVAAGRQRAFILNNVADTLLLSSFLLGRYRFLLRKLNIKSHTSELDELSFLLVDLFFLPYYPAFLYYAVEKFLWYTVNGCAGDKCPSCVKIVRSTLTKKKDKCFFSELGERFGTDEYRKNVKLRYLVSAQQNRVGDLLNTHNSYHGVIGLSSEQARQVDFGTWLIKTIEMREGAEHSDLPTIENEMISSIDRILDWGNFDATLKGLFFSSLLSLDSKSIGWVVGSEPYLPDKIVWFTNTKMKERLISQLSSYTFEDFRSFIRHYQAGSRHLNQDKTVNESIQTVFDKIEDAIPYFINKRYHMFSKQVLPEVESLLRLYLIKYRIRSELVVRSDGDFVSLERIIELHKEIRHNVYIDVISFVLTKNKTSENAWGLNLRNEILHGIKPKVSEEEAAAVLLATLSCIALIHVIQ